MKIFIAAVLYFVIVFGVGFLVGPVRVLYIEPRVGATVAVMLEAPVLLAAIFIGARVVRRWLDATAPLSLVGIGVVALVLLQFADIAVGVLLRGMSVSDHLQQFATLPGMIYAALLIAFMLMPLAVGLRGGEQLT